MSSSDKMSLYMRIDMRVGIDKDLDFAPETILESCVFHWGDYNPNYPYDKRGFVVKNRDQIEFTNIAIKDLQWIIDEMQKLK